MNPTLTQSEREAVTRNVRSFDSRAAIAAAGFVDPSDPRHETPRVGIPAVVYARGGWRQGIIVKVTTQTVIVAVATPTSPDLATFGRIRRTPERWQSAGGMLPLVVDPSELRDGTVICAAQHPRLNRVCGERKGHAGTHRTLDGHPWAGEPTVVELRAQAFDRVKAGILAAWQDSNLPEADFVLDRGGDHSRDLKLFIGRSRFSTRAGEPISYVVVCVVRFADPEDEHLPATISYTVTQTSSLGWAVEARSSRRHIGYARTAAEGLALAGAEALQTIVDKLDPGIAR